MGPKQLNAQLAERWFSNGSVDDIAAEFELPRNVVLNTWRQMKANGTLPRGDRPRSRQSFLLRGEDLSDGRPKINPRRDPLLQAFKEGKR